MQSKETAPVDRIYGELEWKSPLLDDLIASPTVQRLKGVSQLGVPARYFRGFGFSRFEHSLGVMHILRHLGADEEEQVAGLIHDVSHRAFSHVYDWVKGSEAVEDAQDSSHASYVLASELGEVVARHGLDIQRLVEYHHFGLLERETPDLCADRIDYSLRQMEPATAREIFEGLRAVGGQIVMRDYEIAARFGREFLALQVAKWGGYEGVTRYYNFASILRRAMELGIIEEDDFWKEDDDVVAKLVASKQTEILMGLEFLERPKMPQESKEMSLVRKKFRYIDPLFEVDGGLMRLSTTDEEFRQAVRREAEVSEKGLLVVSEPWLD